MQRCQICKKPAEEGAAIETDLLRNTPLRALPEKWSLPNHYALHCHRKHIPERVILAQHCAEVAVYKSVLARAKALIGHCQEIADATRKGKNWPAATGALESVRKDLELVARLNVELPAASASPTPRSTSILSPRASLISTLRSPVK